MQIQSYDWFYQQKELLDINILKQNKAFIYLWTVTIMKHPVQFMEHPVTCKHYNLL